MATIKSYTDIEQSKKLAEILPLESADMSWVSNGLGKPFVRTIPIKGNPEELCGCWSLVALLSVLPNKIVSHETAFEGEDAKGITDIYYKCIESTEDDRYMCRYVGNGYKYKCVADNPIDTCYKMILKLNELKML